MTKTMACCDNNKHKNRYIVIALYRIQSIKNSRRYTQTHCGKMYIHLKCAMIFIFVFLFYFLFESRLNLYKFCSSNWNANTHIMS